MTDCFKVDRLSLFASYDAGGRQVRPCECVTPSRRRLCRTRQLVGLAEYLDPERARLTKLSTASEGAFCAPCQNGELRGGSTDQAWNGTSDVVCDAADRFESGYLSGRRIKNELLRPFFLFLGGAKAPNSLVGSSPGGELPIKARIGQQRRKTSLYRLVSQATFGELAVSSGALTG